MNTLQTNPSKLDEKNFQILEIAAFRPLLVKFISEPIKDKGYPPTHH